MKISRRAILGGSAIALAAPVAVRAAAFLPSSGLSSGSGRPTELKPGIDTIWDMAFWSNNVGQPSMIGFPRPPQLNSPPIWHPEFV